MGFCMLLQIECEKPLKQGKSLDVEENHELQGSD